MIQCQPESCGLRELSLTSYQSVPDAILFRSSKVVDLFGIAITHEIGLLEHAHIGLLRALH